MKRNKIHYQAAAAADIQISPGPAILERVIIGAAGTTTEIADHPDTVAGSIKVKISSPAAGQEFGVNAYFHNGISMTLTTQTDVTVVWRPA